MPTTPSPCPPRAFGICGAQSPSSLALARRIASSSGRMFSCSSNDSGVVS